MGNTWKTTVNNIVQVDQSTFDFPKNTTWDSPQKMPNQHEPYSPLPVTLDMEQNPENNDQYSPGGFPGRFCQKPKSVWFSNEGEVTDTLTQMLKNKESAINSLTREITAAQESGGWISPEGEYIPTEDHLGYISNHPEVFGFKPEQVTSLKEADILMKTAIQNGWVTIRKWGDILAIVANSYYDARKAENEIFNMASQVKLIRIDTLDKQVFTAKVNDFMEQKWGAFLKQPVMAKQAGEQSASVPDYLMNEWKTDQINDDMDEEMKFWDKNNRDYPYGMHDMSDSTSDYPKPEDITPYVVRLDVLYPGPDRPFPFGMPDYETTIFETYPMSDGIEKGNP